MDVFMHRSPPLAPGLAFLAGACNNDDPGTTDTGTIVTPNPSDLLLAPNDPGGVQLPNAADFDYYVAAPFTIEIVRSMGAPRWAGIETRGCRYRGSLVSSVNLRSAQRATISQVPAAPMSLFQSPDAEQLSKS